MELKMELSQKQILSQHMVQSMEILQMSAQELEGYIEKLALENPVIELAETSPIKADTQQEDLQRKLDWLESTDLQNRVYYQQERSDENMEANWHDSRQSEENLEEYLHAQLLLADYTDLERAIVDYLVCSLDSKGYFVGDIAQVAEHFSTSEEVVEEMLQEIQELDPAGVGARNLQECLLLQVERIKDYSDVTVEIIKNYMEEVAKNHLPNIAKKLQVSLEEVQDACEEIRKLNPKPGSSFSDREQLRYISPDAVVVKLEDQFEILINEYQYPGFSISGYYQAMMESTTDEEAKKYLKDKVQQAQWVSNCISQRSSTLSRVMHLLVAKQNDFFMYGPGHKRPMRLVDLAEELNLHESTISRAMRGKYLQCSWGVFPLNYFLTSVAVKSSCGNEGDEKTPEQMKAMIQDIVDGENKKKPYSDQTISDQLAAKGIKLSRRTVNKYRTEMGIPDKSGRKEYI